MSPIFLAHVAVFAAAAVACVAALPRALRIRHAETREGFVALLIAVTLWAGGYVGYLVAPGAPAKVGFYIVGFVSALLAVGAWLYFCAAYTGRSPRRVPYRRAAVGAFAVTALLKVTNPLHGLYFTTAWRTEPFHHLAIQHGPLYWAVLGLSYAVIAVGFFMLLEQFLYTGTDSRPLIGLVALTGIPTVATVAGAASPRLLPLMYEPPGVALFALGTLFVYFRRFETIQFAAESDAAAIFVDRAGLVRDFNRAAQALFPELRDAVGDPLESVLPEFAVEGDEDGLVRVGEGEARRFFRVSRNAFTSGGAMGVELLAVDDVTDRETYRVRLEERTEQLEALNRVVRHDIRNDMAVIHGWAETLRDHVDDDGRDALERVLRKSSHVIELTEIARDFVDSLAADAAPETKPLALRELLDGEIRSARDSFPEATFVVDGDLPSVTVRANELLTSVFRNLLNNAVQHNDTEAPTVTVGVEASADRVRVRVADDGPGIPDEVRSDLFGKGQKGIDSSGSGIGLYLVSILTAQFGGDVWIEGNEPRGAVFVVELPRADGDQPADSVDDADSTATPDRGR